MSGKRENFGSQFGLIMAAVGSAVGLGNIWRFSYILGINGGGAFLLVYLLCVVFVGLPVLITELTIGRRGGLSTISAFQALAPRTLWWLAGAVGVMAAVLISFYYPTVTGWSLGYVFESLLNWQALHTDPENTFGTFIAGWKSYLFTGIAIVLALIVLARGVVSGIEKWCKFLMPMLAAILIILVIRSLTLPGAIEGVKFLFYPDFGKLSVTGFLDALGHSFYSLSLGMGIMITYASYMKKDANLVGATVSIVSLDTGIAIMAGLAIFPAVFAMGLDPGQGAGLAFVTLPGAFAQMPMGNAFSALFFLLLSIAALTSLISIIQVPLSMLEDRFKLSKPKRMAIAFSAMVVFGAPSVLAYGPLAEMKILGLNYFDFLDRVANNICLPIAALLGILFVIFRFGVAASRDEFLHGSGKRTHFLSVTYPFAVQLIAPLAIAVILVRAFIEFL